MNIQKSIALMRQLVKYGIVGLINTGITLSLIFIFTKLFHTNYVVANVIGYVTGFLNSFILNRSWTFKKTEDRWHFQFLKFLIVFIICYLLQLAFLYFLIEIMKFNKDISQLISMVFYTGVSFLINRYVVFSSKTKVKDR